MKAVQYLAKYNVTVDQAFEYIAANINNPAGLFSTLKAVAISTEMLTEIVQSRLPQITIDQVRAFFASHRLNTRELDEAYFQYIRNNFAPIKGGNNNDTLIGSDGDDYIDGGPGNDVIVGLEGNDVLIGGSGSDALDGGWGADYLEGGLGADVLYAGRLSKYVPGHYKGNTWVPGYNEYDLSMNQLYGGGGDDTLYGGYGPDYMEGGDGADRLEGYEGDDTLLGGAGDDVILAGPGADYIDAGDGDDTINSNSNYLNYYYATDNAKDTVLAGMGNDTIYCDAEDDVDAGEGNDRIIVTVNGEETRTGVIKPGEGADLVDFYSLQEGVSVILDLSEKTQAVDLIKWSIASNHGLTRPVVAVKDFQFGSDKFDIRGFNLVDASYYSFVYEAYNDFLKRNHLQFIDSPQEVFRGKLSQPMGPDDYGKGIFVIRKAAAASDDVQDVARFLDPYGNNHTYGKNFIHYFLVNVSPTDMALYQFKDDTGADNVVTADELTPIVRFVGVTTDSLSMDALINSLV